jgi:hypothetical protein
MQYRLTFALLAATATTVLAAPVSTEANVAKPEDYGKYANYGDYPVTSYTTYDVPKDGYGSYGAEVKGKKVARSADDYGMEFHALLNITSN